MAASVLLSEKLKAPIVNEPLLTVVPELFLAPPPDLQHAPATRTRTRAVAPTTRAVRMRMGFCPLSECASDCLGRGGRADEGLILVGMTVGEASRDHQALGQGEGELGENGEQG